MEADGHIGKPFSLSSEVTDGTSPTECLLRSSLEGNYIVYIAFEIECREQDTIGSPFSDGMAIAIVLIRQLCSEDSVFGHWCP